MVCQLAETRARGQMTAEKAFEAVNVLALLAWLTLLFAPRVRIITDLITPVIVPSLLAVAYIIILVRFFDPSSFSNFASLAGLASLQNNPWLLLAGWLHYLAFDLFVGSWEVRTARADGIPHLAIIPSLLMTFMFGPAGLLIFLLTRYALRRRLFT